MPQSFPFTRRQALAGAVLILLALAVGGRLLTRAGQPAGIGPEPPGIVTTTAATGTARAATVAEIVVDVVGAVRRPGLYRLPEGSRVADALTHAGGPTAKAAVAAVNLAAPLADGTQVVVPRRGAAAGVADAGASAPVANPGTGPVHLSTATVEQLDALPGIGPVTAQRIVDFREQNGPFRSVDELDAVPGIGPARLEQLRDLVAP